MPDEPHMAARLLGHQMKELRENAGYKLTEIDRMSTMSSSKISRIENGKMRTQPGDIMYLCRLYGADQKHTDNLKGLAECTFHPNWWEPYRQFITDKYWPYVQLEQMCSKLLAHGTFVPDLLQTDEYTSAVLKDVTIWDLHDYDGACSVKQDRRHRYWQRPDRPTSMFLINEACFSLGVGNDLVVRRQIDHLLFMDQKESVDIRVVLLPNGNYSGMGTEYTVLEFDDDRDPTTVYVASMRNLAYLDKTRDVEAFQESAEQAKQRSVPFRSYYETALAQI